MVTIAGPAGLDVERPAGPPPLTPGAAVRLLAALGLQRAEAPASHADASHHPTRPTPIDHEENRPDGTP